jgi:hypothetical protein
VGQLDGQIVIALKSFRVVVVLLALDVIAENVVRAI